MTNYYRLAYRLNNAPSQTLRIATGTSICGASAIMIVGAVTPAGEDDISVAVSSGGQFHQYLRNDPDAGLSHD